MKRENWYKPRDIARLGLIKSPGRASTESGHYRFIMRQINAGRIKVINYAGPDSPPRYMVSETEIRQFNRQAKKVREWLGLSS